MVKKKLFIIVIAVLVSVTVGTHFIWQYAKPLRNTVAYSSDHYYVDNAMLSYYIHEQYKDYVSQYDDKTWYLQAVGLNQDKSLKKQKCPYNHKTWFDFFVNKAADKVKTMLAYCENALEENTVNDNTIWESVDKKIEEIKLVAKNNNQNLKEYIKKTYGSGVSVDDVKNALFLETIATQYCANLKKPVDDVQLEAFAKQNPENFLYADYKFFTLYLSEDNKTYDALQSLHEVAEQLTEQMGTKTFESVINDYLIRTGLTSKKDSEFLFTAFPYSKDSELGNWLFDTERKTGDTIIIDGNESCTVYYCVGDAYRLSYPSAKLQIISIDGKNTDNLWKLTEKFETAFKKYDRTEGFFDSVALSLGYEVVEVNDVLKGDYESNVINDWIFDKSRVIGDFKHFETEDEIMYIRYCGSGDPCWKVQAKMWLSDERQENTDKETVARHEITEGKIRRSRISG